MSEWLSSARHSPAGSLPLAEAPRPPLLKAFGILDESSRSRPQTPPPLRSTVTGPLLSSVSSADFSRMARRLSDTCPFFTALISCKGNRTDADWAEGSVCRDRPSDHRQPRINRKRGNHHQPRASRFKAESGQGAMWRHGTPLTRRGIPPTLLENLPT